MCPHNVVNVVYTMSIQELVVTQQQLPKSSIKSTAKQVVVIWGFPEVGVFKNGWFTMENPIKMDDANGRERNRFQYMGVSSNGGSLKP